MIRLWAFLLILCSAGGAVAVEVRIETPGASDDLRRELVNSSLLQNVMVDERAEVIAAAQADYGRLLAVLYDHGRFGGVISITLDGREAEDLEPFSGEKVSKILVRVDPGPIYRFSTAQIAPLPENVILPSGFSAGEIATSGAIVEAAEASVAAWRALGFAEAEIVSQDIIADHADRTISAQLVVTSGTKLKFGEISVLGNEAVRSDRIVEISGLFSGPVFAADEIERAENRLRRSGSFASVVISEGTSIGSQLPLQIKVAEMPPRRFGFGAELSSVDGLRLSGFWLHRNLFGGAERFRVDGAISGIGGETGGTDLAFGARYERPATPRSDTDLFFELNFDRLDEVEFKSQSIGIELGLIRYVNDEFTFGYGLGALYTEVEDDFGDDEYFLTTLPLTGELDRRNDALNPTDGYFISAELTPFAEKGGDAGARMTLDGRVYQPVGEELTFAGRVQAGSLAGVSLLDSPAFMRFYSGGGGTVRGQDYQSLALDVGGNRTGGRSLLVLSFEARQKLRENLHGVAFTDWGYVGEKSFPDLSGAYHAGAGLGLRYDTGIGPIRFDVAVPVAGETPASNFYLYLGVGQAF